ncbi:trypsin [Bacteriovorax sp. Seq25_V]|nr:trypsin [Bacteriovorax sp. Seq25_V]
MGDARERFDVNIKKLSLMSDIEKKIILATLKVNNKKSNSIGTAIVLKKEGQNFYFITNNHVIKNQDECDKVILTALDRDYSRTNLKCDKIIETKAKSDNLDYTIFTIKNSDKVSEIFSDRIVEIADKDPAPGELFITAGFGSKSFNERKFDISLSNDSDCKMLAGPIDLTIQDYKMNNTIALGCDVSSGDSGSGVFSRQTGKLVAIFFGAAKISRKNKELTSAEIEQNIGDNNYVRNWSASSWATQLTNLNP